MKKTSVVVLGLCMLGFMIVVTYKTYPSRQDKRGDEFNDKLVQRVVSEPKLDVHFSPKGGCTDEVVKQVNRANTQVLVQAYSFTSQPIVDALIAAHKRGVDVKVILDKSDVTGNGSLEHPVVKAGIPTWIDRKHAIAHNKIMVIDDKTVLTGSFNFTTAAEEHNAENMLTIHSHELAKVYKANWNTHCSHSETDK